MCYATKDGTNFHCCCADDGGDMFMQLKVMINNGDGDVVVDHNGRRIFVG